MKDNLPEMQAVLPEDIKVSFEFDQSPYVTRAIGAWCSEGLLGAVLTGLMVLLFLRDWRSVIVVVLNIPLALLGAVVGLWLTGQTINLMTLGGLALAVGILVDEATVEVENIHTQFEHTPTIARGGPARQRTRRRCRACWPCSASWRCSCRRSSWKGRPAAVRAAVAGGRLRDDDVATSCPARSCRCCRSGCCGTTIQPHDKRSGRFSFARFQDALRAAAARPIMRCGGCWCRLSGGCRPADLARRRTAGHARSFRRVDAGQFQLRFGPPTARGIEIDRGDRQRRRWRSIKDEVGPDKVAISVGYVGVIPSSYPINTIYLWTSGPEEAVLRVALKPAAACASRS